MSVSVKLTDIIPSFNVTQDFSQWVAKLELVAELQGITDKGKFLPLFLSEGAFRVYQGLKDNVRSNYEDLKASSFFLYLSLIHI